MEGRNNDRGNGGRNDSRGGSGGRRFDGRGGGGGGRFNNNRSNSGGRGNFNDKPQEKHKATCTACKKECEVPFEPTEGRDVFCRDCFAKRN